MTESQKQALSEYMDTNKQIDVLKTEKRALVDNFGKNDYKRYVEIVKEIEELEIKRKRLFNISRGH